MGNDERGKVRWRNNEEGKGQKNASISRKERWTKGIIQEGRSDPTHLLEGAATSMPRKERPNASSQGRNDPAHTSPTQPKPSGIQDQDPGTTGQQRRKGRKSR